MKLFQKSLSNVMSHVLFAYLIKLNIRSNEEHSYKSSTKEVILSFQVIFVMQSMKYWAKFHVIGTLYFHDVNNTKFQPLIDKIHNNGNSE